jgi:hypothetical protein
LHLLIHRTSEDANINTEKHITTVVTRLMDRHIDQVYVFLKAVRKELGWLKQRNAEDPAKVMTLYKSIAEFVLYGILKDSYKKPNRTAAGEEDDPFGMLKDKKCIEKQDFGEDGKKQIMPLGYAKQEESGINTDA